MCAKLKIGAARELVFLESAFAIMAFLWDVRMSAWLDPVADRVGELVAQGLFPFSEPPPYTVREPQTKKNYPITDWSKLFRKLELDFGDPDNDLSRAGHLFRRRFRLPFSEFYKQYQQVIEEEWFGEEKLSKRIAPIYMKMMGVYRLLGRNLVYDDITEISTIEEDTMRLFFGKYVNEFSRKNYDIWMRQPQTTADIFANEMVYRSNGCE